MLGNNVDLVVLESMQIMNFSFEHLVKKFVDDEFKYFFKEYSEKQLE